MKKKNRNSIKSIYKFNPIKNIIEPVMNDYSNVGSRNAIYSSIQKELINCQNVLNQKKKIDEYPNKKNGLFFVDLKNGRVKDLKLKSNTTKLLKSTDPFVLVRSKEIADKLCRYQAFFKQIQGYHYWNVIGYDYFTNCLCSIFFIFEKDIPILKLRKRNSIFSYLKEDEKIPVKQCFDIPNVKKAKWQEETERKRQEYLYKRQSFINDNLEKMKMLEKRPAPQLDDVTILIPADKPRFSKKK